MSFLDRVAEMARNIGEGLGKQDLDNFKAQGEYEGFVVKGTSLAVQDAVKRGLHLENKGISTETHELFIKDRLTRLVKSVAETKQGK